MNLDVLLLRAIWRISDQLTKKAIGGFDGDAKPLVVDEKINECYLLIDELNAIVDAREKIAAEARDLDGFRNGPL